MTVLNARPAARVRHGDEVRNARRERRRVAAAALLSLGYSAAQLAERGLSESDSDVEIPPMCSELSDLSTQLAHSTVDRCVIHSPRNHFAMQASTNSSSWRSAPSSRLSPDVCESPTQRVTQRSSLATDTVELPDPKAEDYDKLEELAGELLAELEAERAARAALEAELARVQNAEQVQSPTAQLPGPVDPDEWEATSTADGDIAQDSTPEGTQAAVGTELCNTDGATVQSARDATVSIASRRSDDSTSDSSDEDEPEDGDTAKQIQCTRSVGCECVQCSSSIDSISRLETPEQAQTERQEQQRQQQQQQQHRRRRNQQQQQQQQQQRLTVGVAPDNFTVLKHDMRRAPLHAYTTWLLQDRIDRRVQRLVVVLCHRWRVWARACHTVKRVWARKLGGVAQQMLTCWKAWTLQRRKGRAEMHRRLDREVQKAVTAAQIAAHHYERRGGNLDSNHHLTPADHETKKVSRVLAVCAQEMQPPTTHVTSGVAKEAHQTADESTCAGYRSGQSLRKCSRRPRGRGPSSCRRHCRRCRRLWVAH